MLAFQTGLYEIDVQASISELAAAVDWLFAQDQRQVAHVRTWRDVVCAIYRPCVTQPYAPVKAV